MPTVHRTAGLNMFMFPHVHIAQMRMCMHGILQHGHQRPKRKGIVDCGYSFAHFNKRARQTSSLQILGLDHMTRIYVNQAQILQARKYTETYLQVC